MAPVEPAELGERVVVGQDVVPARHPVAEALPRTLDRRGVHRGHLPQVVGGFPAHLDAVPAVLVGEAVEGLEKGGRGEQLGDLRRVARPCSGPGRRASLGEHTDGPLDHAEHHEPPESCGSAAGQFSSVSR